MKFQYRQYNPDKSNKNMLSWEEISRVITECSEIGIPAILFGTESEHFMHKDAMKAIEFAAEKGIMDIFVATNGVLLSDSIIDRLIEIGITRLTISLDALTEETYKKVRGGDFRKVIENINYFLEKREKSGKRLPVLRITFVKFNLNEHEELAFHNYWQDKVDIVDIQSLLDIKNIDVLKYKSIDSLDCTYPWTMLYISWDGSYKPCCSEYCKYLTLGNIAENTIAEIWKSKKMLRLRRDMLDLKNFPGACINCMRSLHSNTEFKAIKKIQ